MSTGVQGLPGSRTVTFDTTYGIRAEFRKDGSKVSKIQRNTTTSAPASDDVGQAEVDGTPAPSKIKAEQYYYRLIPDWQTSYLWYEADWQGNPPDRYDVTFDEIQQRYPEILPFYESWQGIQEEGFARENSEDEVDESESDDSDQFSDFALQIDGFLLACWLAMQDEVYAVEYQACGCQYRVDKVNMSMQFWQFIQDLVQAITPLMEI